MPTVEERLAAYRDVLDETVDRTAFDDDARHIAPSRRVVRASALPAVAAVAAVVSIVAGGIVLLSRPNAGSTPIGSVPATSLPLSASTVLTAAPRETMPPTTAPADPAAAVEPITLRGSGGAMPSVEQQARNALMTECMASAGFPYEPELVGVDMMAPAEDEVAEVRAWRAITDANAALPGYREAEQGPDGCLGQAFDRMYPVPEQRSAVLLASLQSEASGDIRDRIFSDSVFLTELAGLADCLATKGYEVDATLADPERTNEQISEVMSGVPRAPESVDEYEFVPEMLAALDAPLNAICPTFSQVMRASYNAADRRAGDAWLAEHPDRLAPIREVMVAEFQRFVEIIEQTPFVVDVGDQLVEVSLTADGAGLCGRFVPDGEPGCDAIDPTDPSVFVWVSTEGDRRMVAYGFMPSSWEAWLEVDGERVEVSRSEPGGAARVAIGATIPKRSEADVVELVQVDDDGTLSRTAIDAIER